MSYIVAFLPLTALIILAVSTRRMALSLLISSVLAMILVHGTDLVLGTLDSFYKVLSHESFQYCIVFLLSFGVIMKMFQESGGLQGFAQLIKRHVKGPGSAMFLCWIMDVILFIDEYLNALTVSFSMRNITDSYGIPREHLAFHVNSMACSLCLLIPMSSWTAFTVNLLSENGLGYQDYLKAVPLLIYPMLLVILCLLPTFGLFPKLGYMKKAYERVRTGGGTLVYEKNEKPLIDFGELDESKISSPAYILIPMIVIVGGCIIFDRNMLAGLILGVICQFVMYVPGKLMSFKEYAATFYEGASSMLMLLMVIFMGFLMNEANEQLGLFDLVIRLAGSSIPRWLLPLVTFLVTGALVFATGACWIMMLLAIPIFIPLAFQLGTDPVLTLAALLSGVSLGYSTCFYGDTIFLSSAGTGVNNVNIIRTTLPYAIIAGSISAVTYVILGITM